MTYPTYFETLDHRELLADYPIGKAFTDRYAAMSRDELFAIQNEQFQRLMLRGWQVPFYRRLWGEK
ncbi:MAG: phenylacetate--CoA ligase family protein, partial [Erythrobacter sp.]